MDNIAYDNLIYLVILTALVLFWFFSEMRQNLGRTLQHALAWGLIFLGALAAVGMWQDIKRAALPAQAVLADTGRIEIPVAPDGHYYLNAELNGEMVRFVVDTGASEIVLSDRDAKRIGINPDNLSYLGRAFTANGEVRTAPVRLDSVEIGPIRDTGVLAVVNEGALDQSLLGMSYLQRYSSIQIAEGRLVLTR